MISVVNNKIESDGVLSESLTLFQTVHQERGQAIWRLYN